MKNSKHILISALVLPAILLVSGPAVSGSQPASAGDDLFLQNVYEDYTLDTVTNAVGSQQRADFAALETSYKVSEADLFLEKEYEDYTLTQ